MCFLFICSVIIHVVGKLESAQDASMKALAGACKYELHELGNLGDQTTLPPVWQTDALVLIDWERNVHSIDPRLVQWVELVKICGRPVLHCEANKALDREKFMALSLKPRTNYQPVDCGYYDHFEMAIVKKQVQRIQLTCFGERREHSGIQQLRLLGTKTWRKEEFVEVEGEGWLRADWVKMVDVPADGRCSV